MESSKNEKKYNFMQSIYQKDYNRKKKYTRPQSCKPDNNSQNPIEESYPTFLTLEKCGCKLREPFEACIHFTQRYTNVNMEIANKYFKEPMPKELILKKEICKKRSEYQDKYSDYDKEQEFKRQKYLRLPDNYIYPLTTNGYDFQHPLARKEDAYENRPIKLYIEDDRTQKEKIHKILNTQTGESEYMYRIGKLGEFIIKNEAHGKIEYEEPPLLHIRKIFR